MMPPPKRQWGSPESRVASIKGLGRGRLKSATTRAAEKAEGMAFARAWREANKGRDWTLPANFACKCPNCGSIMP